MSNQSDPIRPQDTPGTPEYCDQKWSPLTEGLSRRDAVYTAVVMENEARFLNSAIRSDDGVSGAALKFIFPTLRRAVPQLLDGDLTLQRVEIVLDDSLEQVCSAASMGCAVIDRPTLAGANGLIVGLAKRTKASIESLRDIL